MHSILLQAEGQQSSPYSMMILLGAMFVIFYFFMIRPQQKKAKDQKKFLEALKKGDQVITIGGIHGRVAEIEGPTVILEVEKGGRMRINKTAISQESAPGIEKK